MSDLHDTQTSYDQLAEEYANHIYNELKDKPLDRELLEQFATRVRGRGLVCDLGCGPGHVARYLAEQGVEACGLDLSAGMVAQARQLNPGIEFHQGSMLALDFPAATWIGATAFYSLIHFTPEQLPVALAEVYRVLRPNGLFLTAFHMGEEVRHVEELWGQPINLDFLFFRPQVMQAALETAGFEVESITERAPYENVEVATQRAYIFARKPG